MSRNRDLANIISGGFTTSDLPTLTASEIPNLDASKITTGSIADARIPASAVSQHATSFDDNKIVNDISTLALRQASDGNRSAYNTNSQFVDVFQDSTGITSLTNAVRSSEEYISSNSFVGGLQSDSIFMVDGASSINDTVNSISGTTNDISNTGGTPHSSSAQQKWSGYNTLDTSSGTVKYDGLENYWNGSGDYTIDFWHRKDGDPSNRNRFWSWDNNSYQVLFTYGIDYGSSADFNGYSVNGSTGYEYPVTGTFTYTTLNSDWKHFRYVRSGSTHYYYFNGTLVGSRAQSDFGADSSTISNNDFRISGRRTSGSAGGEFFDAFYTDLIITPRALSTGASYTLPTEKAGSSTNATGSFESNAITASSSTNKMGAIITYQDQAGTNSLNTDIVLQLSADGGSNFTTATLTAMPDFATGIKMAKVNDLSVTAGTSLKYKISFANQSSGSKEARIRGVSLQY
ncbi:putative lectin [uncultured phage_MedDCM-OCT-S35-C6]|uniref:Putative lectin n=1 Tax=uncultured phage_MedDCM-OCT-S35-C6 TaxID=2741075 RepID=A0A6S4PIC7_9CAUD|nr:putative lectin [uncultured phage_MedDCM-OCT-S35-C6]BAQ94166.1 putative lectin [uncultured phage_MedDCM-OCT-S35-C6]